MIFFDLEFYVPLVYRSNLKNRGTMIFNPTYKDQLVLGGAFLCKSLVDSKIYKEENFWLWNLENEKTVLNQIFNLFQEEYQRVQQDNHSIGNKKIKDIITCGFGISRIDLPTLYIKSLQHSIAKKDVLFDLFLKTKIIDLSNVGTCIFPSETVLYPKTTNEVASHLLLNSSNKASGKQVWKWYDTSEYQIIEERCKKEVQNSVQIYNQLQKFIQNINK